MPTGPIKVQAIPVSREDGQAFMTSLEATIVGLSEQEAYTVYLVVESRRAIAVSFDGDWRPFLGFTRGYNPPDSRAYLESDLGFLNQLADALEQLALESPGGRVFIRQYNATKAIDGVEATLCIYDWPLSNPINQALAILVRKLKAINTKYASLPDSLMEP